MKTFLLILFLALSSIAKAQIVSDFSYDSKTKTISLMLKNEFKETISLRPRYGDNSKGGTYYTITYKDSNKKELYHFSAYVFENKSGFPYLKPGDTQNYSLRLCTDRTTPEITNIDSVEIKLHIEVCSVGKVLLLKKDICETHKWE